jgi:hypothetical protein
MQPASTGSSTMMYNQNAPSLVPPELFNLPEITPAAALGVLELQLATSTIRSVICSIPYLISIEKQANSIAIYTACAIGMHYLSYFSFMNYK